MFMLYISGTHLFGIRDRFPERQFFHEQGWGWVGVGGLGMTQARYIYGALCFYYYSIVTYNEIIIQLTLVQKQWEP